MSLATDERRRSLGEFIRSRRERTTPEMVGMLPGLRRRTPGLRREEMALLSGVGITWYTWLEQGRPINVSAQVLRSVARVLGMDATERTHVFALAELPDPDQVAEEPLVSPAVQAMLDKFNPYPAVVSGPRWGILAGNRAHLGLIGDYMALPAEYRNIVWMIFTDPQWRHLLSDWTERTPLIVARLRAAVAEQVGDPGWTALLERLRRHSPEFRDLWDRKEVAAMGTVVKGYRHPIAGTLRCETSHLWLSEHRTLRMTVHLPLDEQTRVGFEKLMTVEPRILPRPPEEGY